MPFYEYISVSENSCEHCIDKFEVQQSIRSDPILKCPVCGSKVKKCISVIAGSVLKGRQMNQYRDVKHAKNWTDKNGIRHKVTSADGHPNSPTVSSRVTASPDLVERRIKKNKDKTQKKLSKIKHGLIRKT